MSQVSFQPSAASPQSPQGKLKTKIKEPKEVSPKKQSKETSPKKQEYLPTPNELKKIEDSLHVAKNRVMLLRNQLKKERDGINKNRSLTKQTIAKKISVNEINVFKRRDSTEDALRLERLRQKNRSMRLDHQRSLENIQKAIYLVKLDDARQLKNISMQHKKKLKEMEEESISGAIQKQQMKKKERYKAKARYMQYWKEKIVSAYVDNSQNTDQVIKEEKDKELKELEIEEGKLMSQINKYHTKNIEAQKQYVAALSLPAKDVVEALEKGNITINNVSLTDRSSLKSSSVMDLPQNSSMQKHRQLSSLGRDRYQQNTGSSSPAARNFGPKIKIPTAQVNQDKFSIILKQLHKIDKRKEEQRLKLEAEAARKQEKEKEKQKRYKRK